MAFWLLNHFWMSFSLITSYYLVFLGVGSAGLNLKLIRTSHHLFCVRFLVLCYQHWGWFGLNAVGFIRQCLSQPSRIFDRWIAADSLLWSPCYTATFCSHHLLCRFSQIHLAKSICSYQSHIFWTCLCLSSVFIYCLLSSFHSKNCILDKFK